MGYVQLRKIVCKVRGRVVKNSTSARGMMIQERERERELTKYTGGEQK